MKLLSSLTLCYVVATILTSCGRRTIQPNAVKKASTEVNPFQNSISQPLIPNLYTADPSAHVFDGKIYIYPSHDIEAGIPENDNGDHFAMTDYHVFSMDSVGGKVTDHGNVLDIKNIPWAGRQLWAPDAAYKNGTYYLYFPLKDKQDIFRIGVATSKKPYGPFVAQAEPIKDSFSIDPAVFTDDDGNSYLYFGGIWGGQLHNWENGVFNGDVPRNDKSKDNELAHAPRIAKLSSNMLEFAEKPKDILILDEEGKLYKISNRDKRFFEAAWMHKYKGVYYFSYSTGDTHNICYATGTSPYGPFTYQGVVLKPVIGWTNHHSIVQFKNKWYLFYHDTQISNGKTHLRNIKVTELKYDLNGKIITIDPYAKGQ